MSGLLSSILVVFLLTLSPLSASSASLVVATASDLAAVQTDLAAQFEKLHGGATIRWVTAASAILSQQIQNGAPYDVFLSANAKFVDDLAGTGNIKRSSVESYAVGRLALLWSDHKSHPLNDLAENWVRTLAVPNPELAPYGVAAVESLKHENIWTAVQRKIIYGENVRQTLQLFDSGNVDAVLTSDSLLSGRGAQIIPENWHQPIIQKSGVVEGSANSDLGQQFVKFLLTPQAQAIFAKYGFSSPAAATDEAPRPRTRKAPTP